MEQYINWLQDSVRHLGDIKTLTTSNYGEALYWQAILVSLILAGFLTVGLIAFFLIMPIKVCIEKAASYKPKIMEIGTICFNSGESQIFYRYNMDEEKNIENKIGLYATLISCAIHFLFLVLLFFIMPIAATNDVIMSIIVLITVFAVICYAVNVVAYEDDRYSMIYQHNRFHTIVWVELRNIINRKVYEESKRLDWRLTDIITKYLAPNSEIYIKSGYFSFMVNLPNYLSKKGYKVDSMPEDEDEKKKFLRQIFTEYIDSKEYVKLLDEEDADLLNGAHLE